MLTREDDVDVHAYHARGWTISAIARHLGHDGVMEKPVEEADGGGVFG